MTRKQFEAFLAKVARALKTGSPGKICDFVHAELNLPCITRDPPYCPLGFRYIDENSIAGHVTTDCILSSSYKGLPEERLPIILNTFRKWAKENRMDGELVQLTFWQETS